MQSFLAVVTEVLACYCAGSEGKLTVEITAQGEARPCKVFLQGYPASPFWIPRPQLAHCVDNGYSSRHLHSLKDPVEFLEHGVLEVLNRTGYGTISIAFERQRKEKTCVVALVTHSYRWLLPPSGHSSSD